MSLYIIIGNNNKIKKTNAIKAVLVQRDLGNLREGSKVEGREVRTSEALLEKEGWAGDVELKPRPVLEEIVPIPSSVADSGGSVAGGAHHAER